MKDILGSFFLIAFFGYVLYISKILYCVVPMVIQILFSYFIYKKKTWKIIGMVIITQGLVVSVSTMTNSFIIKIADSFKQSELLKFLGSVVFYQQIIYILIFLVATILIGSLVYKSMGRVLDKRTWGVLIASYLINIIIMMMIISRYSEKFIVF